MHERLSPSLYSWASILEPNTREQAIQTASMPFIAPHMALMPDAHLGKGATVGSVIATRDAIMPAAVGVDIGCGMVAVRTQFTEDDVRARGPLSALREGIEARIPLSPGKYNAKVLPDAEDFIAGLESIARVSSIRPGDFAQNWQHQLGSLGGGNHFCEVTVDEQGRVWTFLHSGSRGVGNKIAQHFINAAQDIATRRYYTLPNRDLAYLVPDDREYSSYLSHLHWAQTFAYYNREVMMLRTLDALSDFMQEHAQPRELINCHHNYTERERHFGKDVWVSRKGAIDAHEGVRGLIPGSMGDASYVVTGKGNRMALCSAPHGAGRVYSRSKARQQFTQDDLRQRMAGIEYRDSDAFVDEIPDAYKPIDVVMADAADLVTIDHTLRQLVNVKGE